MARADLGRDMSLDMSLDMRGDDMRNARHARQRHARRSTWRQPARAASPSPAPIRAARAIRTATSRARRSATTASTTTTTASSTAPIRRAPTIRSAARRRHGRPAQLRRRPRRHRLQQARLQHAAALPAPDLRAGDRVRHRHAARLRPDAHLRHPRRDRRVQHLRLPRRHRPRRRVHLDGATDVRLDFTQPAGAAHVISHRARRLRPGVRRQPASPASRSATRPKDTHDAAAGLPAGTYYVIVQSYPGTQGATTRAPVDRPRQRDLRQRRRRRRQRPRRLRRSGVRQRAQLRRRPSASPISTWARSSSATRPRRADFDTSTTSNRYHPTCAGSSTGNDYVVRFTLHETAGVLVQWTQSNGADHVITIFHTPPPGQACDASQMSCYYPGGASGGTVAFAPRGRRATTSSSSRPSSRAPKGRCTSASRRSSTGRWRSATTASTTTATGSSTATTRPATASTAASRPSARPTSTSATSSWGTQQSVTLDVSAGTSYYGATCAKGGGKSKVVRVNLTQPMGLGYACDETGSQVLQLTQLVQPLDACDANPINCADPSVLPFGCNFIMPNLQPGTYDVLVDARSPPATKAPSTCTLFGVQEKTLEICNNGIDDDGDGKIDCADLKCVTSPYCQKFQCRADAELGTRAARRLDGVDDGADRRQRRQVRLALRDGAGRAGRGRRLHGAVEGEPQDRVGAGGQPRLRALHRRQRSRRLRRGDAGGLHAVDGPVDRRHQPERRCRAASTTSSSTPTSPAPRAAWCCSSRARRRRETPSRCATPTLSSLSHGTHARLAPCRPRVKPP